MRFRLIVAAFGVVLAMVGNVGHTPALFVVGLAGCVPLAAKMFALPGRSRAAFTITACAAGLALAACGAPKSGVVTDRKTTVSCIGNNARSCTPKWKVQVTNPDERHPVYTDRPDSGWTSVTEEEYGRCPVGAAWPTCKKGAR